MSCQAVNQTHLDNNTTIIINVQLKHRKQRSHYKITTRPDLGSLTIMLIKDNDTKNACGAN